MQCLFDLNGIQIPRCCILLDEESESNIRLICLADAAEFDGGAVVYAGRKLKSGNWFCLILASKSKLMDATIPRNELSAILLCVALPKVDDDLRYQLLSLSRELHGSPGSLAVHAKKPGLGET